MCIARLRSKTRQNRAEKRPFQHLFIQKTASSFSERERVSLKICKSNIKTTKNKHLDNEKTT